MICVEGSWDQRAGPVEPKSRSGRRRVPLAGPLRTHLAAHRLLKPRGEEELVFGRSDGRVLHSEALTRRARTAWRRAGLTPIGLHECRHTYAAFMIAAGVNAKALSAYMGHSSITITLDRYGGLNRRRRSDFSSYELRRHEQRRGTQDLVGLGAARGSRARAP